MYKLYKMASKIELKIWYDVENMIDDYFTQLEKIKEISKKHKNDREKIIKLYEDFVKKDNMDEDNKNKGKEKKKNKKSKKIKKKSTDLSKDLITKEKIVSLFMENVKEKKYTKKSNNDGEEGQWLEKKMGLKLNSKNAPDIGGYEMKKDSKKISFGDWSGEYLFSQKKELINNINDEKINFQRSNL